MKFVDEAVVFVRGGDGGRGCVSFRREKFVPLGGPDGGDGGKGGDVVLVADPQKNTLLHFHYRQRFEAKRGQHGRGKNQHGKGAPALIIPVPVGTLVRDRETGALLADMKEAGQRCVVARGGLGGRGNARFVTPTRKAPRHAQPGLPGEERTLLLELKLLADVGIVGMPNAGKSTLISVISSARPRIADYPFTTTIPNLGVVLDGDFGSFVVADIPGLIAGAAQGAGLGHQFLRHIERTRLLVHLLDLSAPDPVRNFHVVNEELAAYDERLGEKPQIVVLNKIDLYPDEAPLERLRPHFSGFPLLAISAATGRGVDRLVATIAGELRAFPPP